MRKYYCDKCGKEAKQDSATQLPKLHPLFLLFQEQDLKQHPVTVITHAAYAIEVCDICYELVIEDGKDAVENFKTKVTTPSK